jgi:GT2 family glycosyltransferase
MAIWETNSSEAETPSRLVPSVNGAEPRRPYTVLTLPTSWGGQRSIAVLRWSGAAGSFGTACFRSENGRLIAEARAGGQPALPDFDAAQLLSGLDGPARLRVVRLLLDFCRTAFNLHNDAPFVAACRRLILELSPQPSPLIGRTALTDQLLLCEGTLSPGFGEFTGMVVLTAGAIYPGEFRPAVGGTPDRRGRLPLHLVLDRGFCTPDTLVLLLGRTGLACRTVTVATAKLPTLLEWLERRKGCPLPIREYITRSLAGRGARDAHAMAAVHELQVLLPLPRRRLADPERPVGGDVEVALTNGAGGLFLAGWLHDPHRLIQAIRVTSPFGDSRVLTDLPHRFPRADVAQLYRGADAARAGFVAYLPGEPDPAPALQYRCELLLRSGGRIELVPPPRPAGLAEARAAVLGSIPPAWLRPETLATCIAPAAEPLHAAYRDHRPAADCVQYGMPPTAPAVSVIIPLYRNLDFLRFQIGAFAVDPAMAQAELIFVLDSPEQRAEVEHLLHGLYGLYGLPMTLLVHAANYGYSAANNTGAATTGAPHLLFLNSDVIPDRPGWLPVLLDGLTASDQIGAIGPKLLFEDDSLQHAGLLFGRDFRGRWINQHYYKGLPRDFAPANAARSVPGVTGACLMMPRRVFLEVGGFTEDYIIGDYEDSDLCLKIRAAGYDIRYLPQAELYHLERQSISRHAGYTRTVTSEYNAWLHANRWHDLMEKLMSRPWHPACDREISA